MEFVKVSSFIDLKATGAEKEALLSQVEEVIARIKSLEKVEVKLGAAPSSKEALKAMADMAKNQADLTKEAKKYEDQLLRTVKAEKLLADTEKSRAAAMASTARATKEATAADLNRTKATTETNKQKILQQKYEAAVTKEIERQEKAKVKAEAALRKESDAYEILKKNYNDAAATAKRLLATKDADAKATQEAVLLAQKYYVELVKIETAVGQAQRQVGQYQNATFALNQVLREAPSFINSVQTGFMAISNNLPILSDQYKQLVAATGSSSKAMGILVKSLFTWNTAMVVGITLLTAFGKQIGQFFSDLFAGSKSLDAMKRSQELLNEAFKDSSYADAIKEVKELTHVIKLAQGGFIDKEKALKMYNETIGKTIGEAKTLDEAERLLVKNGPAYIQMMLYKAAANLALSQAAAKALEATQAALKPAEKFTSLSDKVFATPLLFAPGGPDKFGQLLRIQGERRKASATQQLNQEEKDLTEIAQDYQDMAAIVAEKFQLDFFGGQFEDKDDKSGKSNEDFKKLAKKQAEDRLKIQNEITRTRLEGEAAALKEAASKERELEILKGESIESFQARQAASFQVQLEQYQAYYNKVQELNEFNTRAALQELEIQTKNEKEALQEKLDDPTLKLTAEQRADIQQALTEIDLTEIEKRKLISLQGNEAILAFDREYENEITELTKEELDERIKARLEYYAKLEAALKKEFEIQNNNLHALRDQTLLGLNQELQRGEISVKEYNKRRLAISKKFAIEDLDNQIFYFEELLKKTADTEEERADIEAKLAALRLKKDEEITNKKISNMEKLKEAQKRLRDEAVQTFEAIIVARFEREKNQVADQIEQLEEKKQKDIEVANATAANAAEAADRVTVINARAAAQREALERRQRQIAQERARFEKAAAIAKIIADTASAVVQALPDIPLSIIMAGIGALQLARTIATPIPRYKEGVDYHLGGPAIVGDGGRPEYVRNPDGSGWITPDRPTFTVLPRGARVVPNLEKAASIYGSLEAGFAPPMVSDPGAALASAIISDGAKTRRAIKGKREAYFSIVNGKISMITKEGYNETHYLNQNLGF
jgi:hypothetical protein